MQSPTEPGFRGFGGVAKTPIAASGNITGTHGRGEIYPLSGLAGTRSEVRLHHHGRAFLTTGHPHFAGSFTDISELHYVTGDFV